MIHVGRIGLEKNLDFLKRWSFLFCSITRVAYRKREKSNLYFIPLKMLRNCCQSCNLVLLVFIQNKKNCSILRAVMMGVLSELHRVMDRLPGVRIAFVGDGPYRYAVLHGLRII